MEFLLDISSPWFWLTAAILFLIGELLAPGALFMLIFSLAAFATMPITMLTDNIWVLLFSYALLCVIGLFSFRPIFKKRLKLDHVERTSTIDTIIGSRAIATTSLEEKVTGTVKLGYETWPARSCDSSSISEGSSVIVKRIEGNTLIVEIESPTT